MTITDPNLYITVRMSNTTPIGERIIRSTADVAGADLLTLMGGLNPRRGVSDKSRRYSDLRAIVCGLIDKHSPSMPMLSTAKALGLKSHASVFGARQRFATLVADPDAIVDTVDGAVSFASAVERVERSIAALRT